MSRVTFAKLPRREIDAYVASGEPFGKAGAYAVQGRAAARSRTSMAATRASWACRMHETAQLLQRAGVPTALSV